MKFPPYTGPALFLLLIAIAGFALVSAIMARKFTGPLNRPVGGLDGYLPASTATVRFRARDGVALAGWFASPPGSKQAVILLHGHGSTRHQMLARAGLLHDHGWAVLLYDARGHGESSGDHTSVGWQEANDLLGAADFLHARGFDTFGCIGSSQGGATIVFAAAQLPGLRWAVLESVYPTLRRAIDHRFRANTGLPGWLGGSMMVPLGERRLGVDIDEIAPKKHIADLRCPVLVMSGDADPYTRPDDTRVLFAQAREPKMLWMVPGAGHVDLCGFAKQTYEQHLLDFIASATHASAPRPT